MANTILTTVGRQKLISAAPERQVKIQSMVFGDGGGNPVSVNEDMQWVVNQVSMQPAAAPIRAGDNADIIMISAIIPRGVTGFTVREVGLVDADGDLIAIGASEPTDKKESPLSVRVYLSLDNASQVELISNVSSPLDHSLLTGRDSFNAHDASAISRGVVAVDSIADLLALPEGQRNEGLRYLVKGYHAGSDDGGGEFYWDAARVAENDGGTVINGWVRIPDNFVSPLMFGARGDGTSNDTAAFQATIDWAASQTPSTPQPDSQTSTVELMGKAFRVDGLIVHRGVNLTGPGEVILAVGGECALSFDNALYAQAHNLKITLTDANQIGIRIRSVTDSPYSSSSPQLMTFRNVWVEGDLNADTLAVQIDLAWVISFYDCKFFRCPDGIRFTDADSNAIFFYGCELRHSSSSPRTGTAIIHEGGKNNAWIGGVIEGYYRGVHITGGTLTLDNVYTEGFTLERAFVIGGSDAILHFRNCLMKGKFSVEGGKLLTVRDCDWTRSGYGTPSNNIVIFSADVGTRVEFSGNAIPSDFVHARFGWFLDEEEGWKLRSKGNWNECYLDRHLPCSGVFPGYAGVTGDGSRFDIPLGTSPEEITHNPYEELSSTTGWFTPVDNGTYLVKATIELDGLSEDNTECILRLRERGTGSREYTLDRRPAASRTDNSRIILSGECLLTIQRGFPINFVVQVDGGSGKTVGILDSTSGTIRGSYSFTRVA